MILMVRRLYGWRREKPLLAKQRRQGETADSKRIRSEKLSSRSRAGMIHRCLTIHIIDWNQFKGRRWRDSVRIQKLVAAEKLLAQAGHGDQVMIA